METDRRGDNQVLEMKCELEIEEDEETVPL